MPKEIFSALLKEEVRMMGDAFGAIDANPRLIAFQSKRIPRMAKIIKLCSRCLGRASIFMAVLLNLGGLSAFAQFSSGVDGTVVDTSGAVVPGARITITNTKLGVSNTAVVPVVRTVFGDF